MVPMSPTERNAQCSQRVTVTCAISEPRMSIWTAGNTGSVFIREPALQAEALNSVEGGRENSWSLGSIFMWGFFFFYSVAWDGFGLSQAKSKHLFYLLQSHPV